MNPFIRASAVVFLIASRLAFAELTAEKISEFATQEITEMKSFYDAVAALA